MLIGCAWKGFHQWYASKGDGTGGSALVRKLMAMSIRKKQSTKKTLIVQPSDQVSTNAVRYGSTRAMKKMRTHAVPSHHNLDEQHGVHTFEQDGRAHQQD